MIIWVRYLKNAVKYIAVTKIVVEYDIHRYNIEDTVVDPGFPVGQHGPCGGGGCGPPEVVTF